MQRLGTRQAGAMFAELICADGQWLQQEFDALIAANYRPPGPPPPAPPRTPPLPSRPREPAQYPVPGRGPQAVSSHARSGLRRQRSPPPAGTAR